MATISQSQQYLPGQHPRGRLMRLDSARILKRLYFCERSLIVSQSGWLAAIGLFEAKVTLPRMAWEDAMIAEALRERIFELHYPSRMLAVGDDAPLIAIFDEAINAPSAPAFLLALTRVFKPALLHSYHAYLADADELSDGPLLRHLRMAVTEKEEQVKTLARFADELLTQSPSHRAEAERWVLALENWLQQVGGVSFTEVPVVEQPPLPDSRPFHVATTPAHDSAFHLCRFYWPDNIDSTYPYGDGMQLQLRSAVSHFNEIWAIEIAGAMLHAFADDLPWEFLSDAARWTYDEARHTRMGFERLRSWGFEPGELPLGSFIFDSARSADAVIWLGMLHYFETKNISKKPKRAATFAVYDDRVSQHDMDFDWADETRHAHFGKRWLDVLRRADPGRVPDSTTIQQRCDDLVAAQVASVTDAERAGTRRVADAMFTKARRIVEVAHSPQPA